MYTHTSILTLLVTEWVKIPPPPAILGNTSWGSHNLTQFWHWLPRDSVRSHGFRAQSHKIHTHTHTHTHTLPLRPVITWTSDQPARDGRFQRILLICWSGSQSSGKQWAYAYRFITKNMIKAETSLCQSLYGQSYGFFSSCVQMWDLDHKEGQAPKNWCFRIGEDSWESLGQQRDQASQS